MSAETVRTTISRLAAEVLEKNRRIDDLVLVGIQRRGVPIAQRLAREINQLTEHNPPVGSIDITLYRDDLQLLAPTPLVRGTNISFDINGKIVLLVDDVIFTGRTVRAALTELLDFGRPRKVQLLALVDRGHRELPIQPDFVGSYVNTQVDDLVDIYLTEVDGRDEIVLTTRTGSLKKNLE